MTIDFIILGIVVALIIIWGIHTINENLKEMECLGCGLVAEKRMFWKREIFDGDQIKCPKCGSEKVYPVKKAREIKIDKIYKDKQRKKNKELYKYANCKCQIPKSVLFKEDKKCN
ncbi:MAG: hypothetical protein ACOCRO_10830 [Halanaerobiales bacterium]